ncbi:MAG: enoyl-CoA hydratase/isomerase family protein [Burkholderiales bacterium]|nr:enoyl-CoA hydratase/isomerase family protein [Burkholderiales bacterium]
MDMSSPEKDVIQYEVASNGIATIWLNRPHKRNCVSPQLLKELEVAVDHANDDKRALAVIFRGRGDTFCSGADLGQLVTPVLHESSVSLQLAIDSARTYDKIFNMRKPSIAAVEGYAVAGGFELMISCDFALATSDAKIGDFHIRRALFGGAGPIYRLPRMIGIRRSKELMLSGKLLSGDECVDWQLINAAAPKAGFEQLIQDFCAPLIDKSPFCMWMTKMAINRGLDADTNSLITLETMTCNVVHHSEDAKEGVKAFLEKRKAVWTGR